MYRKILVVVTLMLGVDALALAAEDLSLSTLLLAQSQPGHATLERGRYLVKAGDYETGHTRAQRDLVYRPTGRADIVRRRFLDQYHRR